MFKIIEGKLFIEIPVYENPPPSSTGKTLLVACTHGNIQTGLSVQGKPLFVSVNAFVKK